MYREKKKNTKGATTTNLYGYKRHSAESASLSQQAAVAAKPKLIQLLSITGVFFPESHKQDSAGWSQVY